MGQARCASVTPTVFVIPTWYARHANDDPIFLKLDESSRRLQTLPNQDTTWGDAEECLGKLTRDCSGDGCVRGLHCPAWGRKPLEGCLRCNGKGVVHHMELPDRWSIGSAASVAEATKQIENEGLYAWTPEARIHWNALKAKHNMPFEPKTVTQQEAEETICIPSDGMHWERTVRTKTDGTTDKGSTCLAEAVFKFRGEWYEFNGKLDDIANHGKVCVANNNDAFVRTNYINPRQY